MKMSLFALRAITDMKGLKILNMSYLEHNGLLWVRERQKGIQSW